MSLCMESGVSFGANLATTLPFGSTRNFVKFHLMPLDKKPFVFENIREMDQVKEEIEQENAIALSGELERLDGKPETIPQHVWDLMRENGELAVTGGRVYEGDLSVQMPSLPAIQPFE